MSNVETLEIDFGHHVKPYPLTTHIQRRAILYGYSIYETTGSATAQFNIYNGTDTGGLLVCPILLAKSQSAEDWFGPQGIELNVGVFTSTISGTVGGSLFLHFPHH